MADPPDNCMTIYVDTREQLPYEFAVPGHQIPWRTVGITLSEGDYAVSRVFLKLPSTTALIERKTLADLYQTMGNGRNRFGRELERIADAQYGYAVLLIEADWTQILNPNEYLRHPTQFKPKAALASLLAWSQRFRLHLFAVPGRELAELIALRIFERWIRDGCA